MYILCVCVCVMCDAMVFHLFGKRGQHRKYGNVEAREIGCQQLKVVHRIDHVKWGMEMVRGSTSSEVAEACCVVRCVVVGLVKWK